MSIKLYSRYHVEVPLFTEFPPRLKEFEIEKAKKWMALEDENAFLFQELSRHDFIIRFQSLLIRNPTTFTINSPGSICLQVSLYRTLEYELSGLETKITVHHRRFNLLSAPMFSARYKTVKPKTTFSVFELWLSKELLQPFASKNPSIAAFLNDVENGRPVQLFEQSQIASEEMMALIDLISQNGNDLASDSYWIPVYVSGILEQAFGIAEKKKAMRIKKDDINRVYEIVDILQDPENMDSTINQVAGDFELSPHELVKYLGDKKKELRYNSWSVEELAAFAGMNVYRLEKLFKEAYNCTIKEYRKRMTWQSALVMLLSKSDNLKSISAYAGFHTASNFNRAFKKRFNITPVEYVQQWAKKLEKFKKTEYRNPPQNLEGT